MTTIHWNDAALRRALRTSQMKDAVERLGDRVADKVRDHAGWDGLVEGVPGDMKMPVKVVVHDGADGVSASVLLAHPSGLSVHAKHGVLNRAASDLGLEVN